MNLSIFQKNMKRQLLFVPFLLLAAVAALGQVQFMPVLHNFSKSDYGGALQNWSITQDSTGLIWVGNGAGLLGYDGYSWHLHRLPGNAVARSVLAVGSRIYVGAYQEFGFFTRQPDGSLAFTSLWPKGFQGHEDEIWNIVRDRRGHIYFQSFSSWFDYDGHRVTPHYSDAAQPLYFFQVDGEVYVQINQGDFYHLVDGQLQLLFSRKAVGDDHIVAAVSGGPGRLLLCSQWHGVFVCQLGAGAARVTRMPTQADAALMAHNVNRATLICHDSLLVVGTILSGIYAIDRQGRVRWHYSMANWLNNNTVLSLFTDASGDVWAALDVGLAHIYSGSAFSLISPAVNQGSWGMVYGICASPMGLYVSTNQAAWLLSPTASTMVAGSTGQNWFVGQFGNQILLGNNAVTQAIQGTVSAPLGDADHNGSTAMRECTIHGQHVLIESSYYSLRVYRQQPGGQWRFSHDVQGFHAPVNQLEVDAQGHIWCSHMSHGLYQLTLTPDLRSAQVKYYPQLAADSTFGLNRVMLVRGRVLFSQANRLYTFDDLHSSIVPFTELDGILGDNYPLSTTATADDATFWLTDNHGYSLVHFDGQAYRCLQRITPDIFGLEMNDNISYVYVNGRYAYFGLNNGIGRYDMQAPSVAQTGIKPQLRVASVTTTDLQGQSVNLSTLAPRSGQASQVQSNVTITLSYPNYDHAPLQFHFHLEGGGADFVTSSPQPVATFSALGYGTYHFTCTVTRGDGAELGHVDYWFTRPRPFWLSWWAIVIYVLLLAAGIYALVIYRTHKTEEQIKRQFADKKLQEDFAKLEQSRQEAEQERQQLASQLDDKNREVANMALEAARRSTAIVGIKDAIRERQRKGDITQAQMIQMLRAIGDNPDSSRQWQVFEQQFDLVHNNYFKHLKQQYPSLTASDLRFCALLRMNFTTKQIAEFQGMSVRGVEGARYRLRKKLHLPEGSSLVDFLLHFD